MLKRPGLHHMVGILMSFSGVAWGESLTTISADDSRIQYAGFAHKAIISVPDAPDVKLVRFERILDMPGKGYRWDNPGVSVRFRTDATEIEAALNYSEQHSSTTARNGVGVYSVDGVFKPEWSFQTVQKTAKRLPEKVSVSLAKGGVAGFHNYEIFLPYGDSVDFAGLGVNADARFEPLKPKSTIRYVAYGDSITHGFSASAVDKTYSFLLGREKDWELIDLGFGGRSSGVSPSDAGTIISLKPDVLTVLIGVNDWQGGVPLDRFRDNMKSFFGKLRAEQPVTPVYLLTPLWVNPTWKPEGAIAELESYRQVLREVGLAANDANLQVIEGPDLIDPDASLFDRVAVHPNDAGFAMMAGRLAKRLNAPEKKPTPP